MCLRIFLPTPRRLLLFLIFLVLTASGILAIIPPFQQLFGLPYLMLSDYIALIAQIIYSYILACIYAFAYVWLEASIRKRYPHMNDIMKKRQEPAIQPVMPHAEPAARQKPPASRRHHAAKAHVKVHAKAKKAVKRRKR